MKLLMLVRMLNTTIVLKRRVLFHIFVLKLQYIIILEDWEKNLAPNLSNAAFYAMIGDKRYSQTFHKLQGNILMPTINKKTHLYVNTNYAYIKRIMKLLAKRIEKEIIKAYNDQAYSFQDTIELADHGKQYLSAYAAKYKLTVKKNQRFQPMSGEISTIRTMPIEY